MHCLDWSLGLRLWSYFALIAYGIFVFLVITLVHTFLYFALIFDGLDTKTMQAIKIVQHYFDKIIFYSDNCMVTENRPAT